MLLYRILNLCRNLDPYYLRLWEETPDLKVVGSNPTTIYWMDIFSHLFVVINCNVWLKKSKINKKEVGDCPLKSLITKIDWPCFGSQLVLPEGLKS